MIEKILQFGPEERLQGIVTEPGSADSDTAVLLLNAGMVHKAGPFRMNAIATRYFARENQVLAFRFDISGLGDSAKVKDGSAFHDRAVADIQQAIDALTRLYRVKNVVVMGLCTGADLAHKAAVADERITGVIWLDGYGYPTSTFKRNRLIPVFTSPGRLINALCRIGRNVANRSEDTDALPPAEGADNYFWTLPPKEKYIQDMRLLKQRQVRCMYFYSSATQSYYNYEAQMADAFADEPFIENIQVQCFKEADHAYVITETRDKMLSRASQWLAQTFDLSP